MVNGKWEMGNGKQKTNSQTPIPKQKLIIKNWNSDFINKLINKLFIIPISIRHIEPIFYINLYTIEREWYCMYF